jgi:hypothetical protein
VAGFQGELSRSPARAPTQAHLGPGPSLEQQPSHLRKKKKRVRKRREDKKEERQIKKEIEDKD